jgi:hypothetical protein
MSAYVLTKPPACSGPRRISTTSPPVSVRSNCFVAPREAAAVMMERTSSPMSPSPKSPRSALKRTMSSKRVSPALHSCGGSANSRPNSVLATISRPWASTTLSAQGRLSMMLVSSSLLRWMAVVSCLAAVMSWMAPIRRRGTPSRASTSPTMRTQMERPVAVVIGTSRSKAWPAFIACVNTASITGCACGSK